MGLVLSDVKASSTIIRGSPSLAARRRASCCPITCRPSISSAAAATQMAIGSRRMSSPNRIPLRPPRQRAFLSSRAPRSPSSARIASKLTPAGSGHRLRSAPESDHRSPLATRLLAHGKAIPSSRCTCAKASEISPTATRLASTQGTITRRGCRTLAWEAAYIAAGAPARHAPRQTTRSSRPFSVATSTT